MERCRPHDIRPITPPEWPPLALADGLPTDATLHRWPQIAGKTVKVFAILSKNPVAVELRALFSNEEQNAYSQHAAREFAFDRACAIILSEGSAGSQKPTLLLSPGSWKEGRLYEAIVNGASRHLRCIQLVRRGDDYVRATFEWTRLAEEKAAAPSATFAAG